MTSAFTADIPTSNSSPWAGEETGLQAPRSPHGRPVDRWGHPSKAGNQ